jgi:hypothetical protein
MNIIAYTIYLLTTSFITLVVGKKCHKYGYLYILKLFDGNVQTATAINNTLLLLYYLLNIGYAALILVTWQVVPNLTELIYTIASKIGLIVATLALIHYANIGCLLLASRYVHKNNIII